MTNTYYMIDGILNGRRETFIEVTLDYINRYLRTDKRIKLIGEPVPMSYGPQEKAADCAIWGNE